MRLAQERPGNKIWIGIPLRHLLLQPLHRRRYKYGDVYPAECAQFRPDMTDEPLTDRQHRRVREPMECALILEDVAQCGIGPHFLGCNEFVSVGHLASCSSSVRAQRTPALPAATGAYHLVPSVDATASAIRPHLVLDASRSRTRRVEAALGLSVDVRGQWSLE